MTSIRHIGYWRNAEHPEYPDPAGLVDESWDDDERHAVWYYLSNGTTVRAYMGFSSCRICGQDNGALEFSDGFYQWPEGLSHYVEEHAVRLPSEFVEHVQRRLDEYENSNPTLDWWLSATS